MVFHEKSPKRLKLLLFALTLGGLFSTSCSDRAGSEPRSTTSDAGGGGTAATKTSDATETGDSTASDAEESSTNLRLEGLSAPVEVRFDGAGVLHLQCETELDCYRAQGYFHADDRFFAMDLIRRRTLGELTSLFGNLALDTDKKFRHFMTTRNGRPLEDVYFEAADEQTRKMFRAYTAGVNAWLADMRAGDNGAALTEEYDFPLADKEAIRDWRPTDSVALYLQFAYVLGQKSEDDIFRGRLASELPPAAASDLLTTRPGIESNIMQASGVDPKEALDGSLREPRERRARFRRLHERLAPANRALRRARRKLAGVSYPSFGPRPGGGSNNWAVAKSHTANGAALMANDPHLTLNNPSIWYYVEMNVRPSQEEGLHVAGASVPAVPGVVVGHNEDVAWGITTARYDLADAYVETLTDDGDAVMYRGERVPLTRKEFTFELPGGDTETATFEWVPHHGPLISKDVDNNRGVSVRWVAQEGGDDLNFFRSLMHAQNLEEARKSLTPINNINACWVLASTEGDIGWYPMAKLPERPWTSESPNWLPLPGGGEAEWEGFLDKEALPSMTNPPRGFIATANNDFDGSFSDGDNGDDGHTPWQSPPAYGHRHARIVDLLERGGTEHTVESMTEIQADTHSLHGERLVPEVVEAARSSSEGLSERAAGVLRALDRWTYGCPTGLDGIDPDEAAPVDESSVAREAAGCAAFHVLLPRLTDAVFGDELTEHTDIDASAHWFKFQAPLLYAFQNPSKLENGADYFDDVETGSTTETKTDAVREALRKTADALEKSFESDAAEEWQWGRIHTLTLRSFFDNAGVREYNYGRFASDGGFATVDVAPFPGREGDFAGEYDQRVGASTRIVVEAGADGMEARFQLPGGQDLHRDSRWYNSLLERWLRDRYNDLHFRPSAVENAAVRTVVARPGR